MSDSVRIVSVWWEEWALMNWMAEDSEGRVITDRVRLKCSKPYEASVEGSRRAKRLDGGEDIDRAAAKDLGSQRSLTFAWMRAPAISGQTVSRSDSWTISVSNALHADG